MFLFFFFVAINIFKARFFFFFGVKKENTVFLRGSLQLKPKKKSYTHS